MNKKGSEHAIFWIVIVIAIIIAIIASINKAPPDIIAEEGDNKVKAIKLVQEEGSKTSVLEVLTTIIESSEGYEIIGWDSVENGEVFDVTFKVQKDGETKSFTWEVDILRHEVKATNDNAKKIMKNVE